MLRCDRVPGASSVHQSRSPLVLLPSECYRIAALSQNVTLTFYCLGLHVNSSSTRRERREERRGSVRTIAFLVYTHWEIPVNI